MQDPAVILSRIGEQNPFGRSDLQAVMKECGYRTSESIVNHTIKRMLAAGDIARIGRNRYCLSVSLKTLTVSEGKILCD